jgi:hypothetical protein
VDPPTFAPIPATTVAIVPPAAKVVVVASLDGPEAIASYDSDAFTDVFASARGVSKDDMEVVTSVKQDMTLGGVTELSDDVQVALVISTAGAMGVDPKAVSLSGMTSSSLKSSRSLAADSSLTVSMQIVVPIGVSVLDMVASAEKVNAVIRAGLSKAGIEMMVSVEVTGLSVTGKTRITNAAQLDTHNARGW